MLAFDHRQSLQQGAPTAGLQEDLEWLRSCQEVLGIAAELSAYEQAWSEGAGLDEAFFGLNLPLSQWVDGARGLHYGILGEVLRLSLACYALQQDWEQLPLRVEQLQRRIRQWQKPLLLADGSEDAQLQAGIEEMLDALDRLVDHLQLALESDMESWELLAQRAGDTDARFAELEASLPLAAAADSSSLLRQLRETPMPPEFRFFLGEVERVLLGELEPEKLQEPILVFFGNNQQMVADPRLGPQFIEALDHFRDFTQQPRAGHLRRGSLALLRLARA